MTSVSHYRTPQKVSVRIYIQLYFTSLVETENREKLKLGIK